MPVDAVDRVARSWPGRGFYLTAAFALLPIQTCAPRAGSQDCLREPAPALAVWVESGPPTPPKFRGTMADMDTTATGESVVITVRDSLLVERKIHVSAAGSELPLRKGRAYEFQIETVGGFPTASGMIVRDSTGIVFAGASDQTLGSHVLKEGVPGFTMTLISTECPSRPHDDCYDGLYNLRLVVTHAGRTVRLMHPDSGRLDDYLITCRLAQRVVYNSKCADAGLPGVSWTMDRTGPAAPRAPASTE
jgi:hypothetical protein